MEYFVGQRVKTIRGLGTIINIMIKDEEKWNQMLVEHDDFHGGHDGNGIGDVIGMKKKCWWYLCKDSDIKPLNPEQKVVMF